MLADPHRSGPTGRNPGATRAATSEVASELPAISPASTSSAVPVTSAAAADNPAAVSSGAPPDVAEDARVGRLGGHIAASAERSASAVTPSSASAR